MNDVLITSVNNPLIKLMVGLKEKKNREALGQFLIEGIRFTEEAFNAGANVSQAVFSQRLLDTERGKRLLNLAEQAGTPLQAVAEKILAFVADTEMPQGIIAAVKIPNIALANLELSQRLLVIVDGIKDPGNLGTIVRTALAARAAGVICTKGTVDIYNPKSLRATMGAIFKLPVLQGFSAAELSDWLNKNEIPLLVADAEGEEVYYEAVLAPPLAVVIGNEGHGPGELLSARAHKKIRIPLHAEVESLNAAIAAALILFEGRRQSEISKPDQL